MVTSAQVAPRKLEAGLERPRSLVLFPAACLALKPVLRSETRCWAGAEVLLLTAQISSV